MSQHNSYGYQNSGGYGMAPPPQRSKSGLPVIAIIIMILAVFFLFSLACVGLLVMLLLPAMNSAQNVAQQMQDSNNMKMVGLALLNYEATYRVLPASYAVNSEGEKVWSWRVAILPYIEEVRTYQRINFNDMKPWNDPSNSALQGSCSPILRSIRSGLAPGGNESNVFLISNPKTDSGSNSFFVDNEYPAIHRCIDGTSNTLVAIMLAKHSVPWASPETLSTEEAYRLIQNEELAFVGLFLDGTVRKIKTSIDEKTFRALVTCNGREKLSLDSLEP